MLHHIFRSNINVSFLVRWDSKSNSGLCNPLNPNASFQTATRTGSLRCKSVDGEIGGFLDFNFVTIGKIKSLCNLIWGLLADFWYCFSREFCYMMFDEAMLVNAGSYSLGIDLKVPPSLLPLALLYSVPCRFCLCMDYLTMLSMNIRVSGPLFLSEKH